jgi:hypothetical protein
LLTRPIAATLIAAGLALTLWSLLARRGRAAVPGSSD